MANRPSHRRNFNGSADFQRGDCSGLGQLLKEYLGPQPSSSQLGHVTEGFNQHSSGIWNGIDTLLAFDQSSSGTNQYSSGIWDGTENVFGLDQSSTGTGDVTEDFFDFDGYSRQDEVTITTETSFERESLLHPGPSASRDQGARVALGHVAETTEGTVIAAASDPLVIPFVNQPMRGENLDPQQYPTSEDIDIDVSNLGGQDKDQAHSPSKHRPGKQPARRVVKDRQETARTRESKACVSCKVQKRVV